ncbi:MAG: FliA/WhiG family RNA polymerase sigma factor [Burkholderiaceae bacterium]|jgi:RNA polymerase sigma factor for flagellar operon FliA|nr:FliA/WhiG family RNA polymerase sigma factor [Burkholderiaceae bacterium]
MTARRNAYAQSNALDPKESVTQYAPLVRRLAFQIASRLPPNVDLDDLIQEGMMGLLDAIKRYEPRPGLNFEAYARFRITGAIYDSCRENDILPRNQRDKLSELEKTVRRLEQELGRSPTEQEIADACEISIEQYHETLDTAIGMTAIDDVPEHLLPIAEGADPSQITSFKQIAKQLAGVIKDLPEKERMVVALHYQEDLSFREVAYVMDLTPGRISQIHTQAMLRIRSHLGNDLTFRP